MQSLWLYYIPKGEYLTKIHNKAQAPLTEVSTPVPLDLYAATDKAQLNPLKLNHVGMKIGTIPTLTLN